MNLDVFKSRQFNHDEIFQIQGMSDVSLMGNDSPSKIETSKILLAGLGPKFEELLQASVVKLDYPFEAVQAIHDFTLSGFCNFDSTNLRSLVSAASEFNIVGIKAQAGPYLVASVNIGNVHELYQLSELLCIHTTQKTREFILDHFEELGRNENFLKICKPNWMRSFIKEDTLNSSEENAFKILLNWGQQSSENEQSLPNLASFIRFGLMDQSFFDAVVKTCPFLQNNALVHSPRKDKPRINYELVFAVGFYGVTAHVYDYDTRAERWCQIDDSALMDELHSSGQLMVLDDFGEDKVFYASCSRYTIQ